MRSLLLWISGIGTLLTAASCQKVIDLKVGDSTPRVVIEGQVTDSLQPWTVLVSKTIPFGQSTRMDAVRGAQVAIRDLTAGATDSLIETAPGFYATPTARAGIAGHSYAMSVTTAEGTYTATSTMPARVPVDSVRVEVTAAFGRQAAQIFVVFTDPPGIPNYYRFLLWANGEVQRTETRDDRYSDGRLNGRPNIIPYDKDKNIGSGTEIKIEMQGIDESVFKYFSTLRNADGNSAAPANPVSNIRGGALGYFGALSVQELRVVLP